MSARELERDEQFLPHERVKRFGASSVRCTCSVGAIEANFYLIDLLHALNDAGAEHLIVGGYAVAHHGRIRTTKDFNNFIGTDPRNARNVRGTRGAIGTPSDELRPEVLATLHQGAPTEPVRYHYDDRWPLFEIAWGNRVPSMYGGIMEDFIGRFDLIANKADAGRP